MGAVRDGFVDVVEFAAHKELAFRQVFLEDCRWLDVHDCPIPVVGRVTPWRFEFWRSMVHDFATFLRGFSLLEFESQVISKLLSG